MSADANDRPATREPDVEVIDLEMVDDTADTMSPEDFVKSAPDMLVQVFRGMLKEKLKRLFIRSLIWATVLIFLAQDYPWARTVFWIWAIVAALHLTFLLYGWYAAGKQGAKLAQMFGGGMPQRRD